MESPKCPTCNEPLTPHTQGKTLICINGHQFTKRALEVAQGKKEQTS